MQNSQNNTPNVDPSGLFNTYTEHPGPGDFQDTGMLVHPETIHSLEEKKKVERNQEPKIIRIIRIIVEGFVRIAKIAAWSIVILGCLFVVTLATNTTEKAISIINNNLGSHITAVSGEVTVAEKNTEAPSEKTGGITSSALNTTTSDSVPDEAAAKRKAILEARKAARLLEEQQKAVEKTSQ